MLRGDTAWGRARPEEDGLESYRRLIELQKQMIELSRKHEISKRERDALREQVASEARLLARRRASLSHRLRRSTAKLITLLSGVTFIPIALEAIHSTSF